MLLHEFMDDHRVEIFDACTRHLRESVPTSDQLDADLKSFVEEIVRTLKREAGHPDSQSPLPGRSEAAARLGATPQRAGVDPVKIPMIFGAISNAIGEVGQEHGLEIRAADYKVFNQCIDAGVATSIQEYRKGEHQEQQKHAAASAGELAHELRQALGNATLAYELLCTGSIGLNGKTGGVLADSLTRMELLLARTLGDVQLDAGVVLPLRPMAVAVVLRKLGSTFISDRAISLALEVDDSLHIWADEMLLVSAVSNLLSNASKFTCSGGKIVLRCYAHENTVVVEVEDECGGLKVDDTSQLLLPFVKGTEDKSNVGLGLSIVKRAVEAMAGRVHITNHPGKGCTFALSFPRAWGDPPSVDEGTT